MSSMQNKIFLGDTRCGIAPYLFVDTVLSSRNPKEEIF